MPYVARSPLYSEVLINPTEEASSVESTDRWNNWVFESELEYEYARTKYVLDDSLHIAKKSYRGMELLLVKSLGEHWSAGASSLVYSSSYDNSRLLFSWSTSLCLYSASQPNLNPVSMATIGNISMNE